MSEISEISQTPENIREETINKAIFRALATCMKLDPDSPRASRTILRAYGEQQLPRNFRDHILVFYDLSPDPGARMYTEHSVLHGVNEIYRFIPCTLTLVFYGFFSFPHAFRVRENLFLDGEKNPRSILRKAGIYPEPSTHPVPIFWEEIGGKYHRRADLNISAWVLVNCDNTSEGAIPASTIETPPSIHIHGKEG